MTDGESAPGGTGPASDGSERNLDALAYRFVDQKKFNRYVKRVVVELVTVFIFDGLSY
jgi:hypothetical protein